MNDIHKICKYYNITNYKIKGNIIDVYGDVNFYNKGLLKIPLNFGKVTGNFSCAYNKLTSLDGCPKWIGGHFFCHGNKLKSIKGPLFIGGDFFVDKSIIHKLDNYYEIDTTLEIPIIKNYNNIITLSKRNNNIKSILKNSY
jgi:hypothetical protein